MRGSECWTDHFFPRSNLSLRIRPPARQRAAKRKLNRATLKQDKKCEQLRNALSIRLNNRTSDNIHEGLGRIAEGLAEAAAETVGFAARKNKDWFHASLQGIQIKAFLSRPSSGRLKEEWRQMRGIIQRTLRNRKKVRGCVWRKRCKVSPILVTFTTSTTYRS